MLRLPLSFIPSPLLITTPSRTLCGSPLRLTWDLGDGVSSARVGQGPEPIPSAFAFLHSPVSLHFTVFYDTAIPGSPFSVYHHIGIHAPPP